MPTLKIKFVDFWEDLNGPENNYFFRLLSQHYNVEFSDNPDILFYSCYGREYLNYKCTRIFYSPENWRPDFNGCDIAITFDYNKNPNHFRFPLWKLYYIGYIKLHGFNELLTVKPKDAFEQWQKKKNFCCFIISNSKAKKRIEFFNKLNSYKSVDSAGKYLNNIGYFIGEGTLAKLNYIKDYRFVISFENEEHDGYTTEKLIEPLLVNSIPIYWGNPKVSEDFNTKRFLYYRDFINEKALIDKVLEIERDPVKAFELFKESPFSINEQTVQKNEKDLLDFLIRMITKHKELKPVSQYKFKRFMHNLHNKKKILISKFL
jgi:hypothetical protein